MRRRPDGHGVEFAQNLARDLVDLCDELDFVAPELHAYWIVGIRRKHVERVAAHAEGSAFEFIIVAIVLDVDKLVNDVVALERASPYQERRQARVVHRRADTVNAAHRRHHNDIAAREQARRGLMAQLLDLFVDRCVFLNKGIGRRHVRLGLVVIVIAKRNRPPHYWGRILELSRKLGRERLIGFHDERGLLSCLDDFRHGECLARARDAQKVLITQAALYAVGELLNRLRLVARRLVGRDDLERHALALDAKAAQLGADVTRELDLWLGCGASLRHRSLPSPRATTRRPRAPGPPRRRCC